jgi:DNA-binding IclR family transcriptional regulator
MSRIKGSTRGTGVQAVLLALQVVEHLSQSRAPVGVSELARHFGTTKSRMHRHLQTLVAAGYVARESESDRYRSSGRLISLGQAASETFELTRVARPVMEDLRERLGHAVTLSQPEDDGMRVMATIRGTSEYEFGVRPGSMLAPHATAQGKLLLAFGDTRVHEHLAGQPLPAATPQTIVDWTKLRSEIAQVKRQGWATAPNQTILGINALAAPILDVAGTFLGAIAIVDSIQFVADKPTDKQLRAIRAAARTISAGCGRRAS